MRKIKSAPADLCKLIKLKEVTHQNKICFPLINNKDNKNNIENYTFKKTILYNKKKITDTLSGILSDTYIETNKYITSTDNIILNSFVEFINKFLNNKLTQKNVENLLLSLMVRYIIGNIYHDILIKVKELYNLN